MAPERCFRCKAQLEDYFASLCPKCRKALQAKESKEPPEDIVERLLTQWHAVPELRTEAADEIKRLRAELDALKSKLPKTADGMVVVPGLVVFFWKYAGDEIVERTVRTMRWDRAGVWLDWKETNTATGRSPEDVYSTREAARMRAV
jgi:hypothetical protein